MSTFSYERLSDENKTIYNRLMSVIDKNGLINLGRIVTKTDGTIIDYSTLSQCWNHTTGKSSNGYGQICINHKTQNLHRLSYWIHNGCPDMSNRKKHVCHSCDNPDCANPDHLSYKSAKENIEEAVSRIRIIKPKKTPIRTTVACNNCRADTHHKCDGFPCSQCLKKDIECIKEEHVVTSGAFKKGQTSGENNIKCKNPSTTIYEIREKVMKGLEYGGLKNLLKNYPDISYTTLQAIVGRETYRTEPEATPPGWLEYLKNKKKN